MRHFVFIFLLTTLLVPSYVFASTNLVANPSLETASGSAPQNWSSSVWGTTKATFTYPTGGAHTGNRYVKTQVTQAGSGDAKWFPAQASVTPGTAYTFSNWYQSNVATEIDANFILSDGTSKYVLLKQLPASASWSQAQVTFTTPANAKAIKIYHLIEAAGTLAIDDYSLALASEATTTSPAPQKPVINSFTASPSTVTQGQASTLSWSVASATTVTIDQGVGTVSGTSKIVSPTATTTYTLTAANSAGSTTASVTVYVAIPHTPPPPPPPPADNLIQNGDLESGTTNPTGWNSSYWGSLTPTFTYPVAGNGGGKAAKVTVTNYQSGDAKWNFTPVPLSSHTVYQLSEEYTSSVTTNVTLEYKMTDGSYKYVWLGDLSASPGWSTFKAQLIVPSGAVSLRVMHALVSNGSLTIDNFSLVALPPAPFANGMISFVFDDGLHSQYQNAVPLLAKAGILASFGIITSEPSSGDSEYMTWAQIKELQTKGYEISAHTRTHPDLTTLSSSQLQSEVAGAKSDLAAQGITSTSFVYPYGAVNSAVEAAVGAAGFAGARGSAFGLNTKVVDHYNLYDIRLDSTSNLATIKQYIDQAAEDKRWLVFEIHDVLASGGDWYTITPAFLQSIIDYMKSKGVSAVTLQNGMSQLNP